MKGLVLHNTLTKLTFFLFLLYPLYSQVSNGGDPKSIHAGLTDDIPQVIMPLVDRDALLKEDEIEMANLVLLHDYYPPVIIGWILWVGSRLLVKFEINEMR